MSFDFSLDPFEHFLSLYQNAEAKKIRDANAMSLATIAKNGFPNNRIVLYKGLCQVSNSRGFSFYTNYEGGKGQELEMNPKAAACFFWPELEQQIRIQGEVVKLSSEQSDAYFKTRARLSQIGAWASDQSAKLSSIDELEKKVQAVEARFAGQEVPRPPHWGGFCLLPLSIEFWFGRNARLHERYVYERSSLQNPWSHFIRSP